MKVTFQFLSLEPTSYGPGQFPINRREWEEELSRLFDAIDPHRDTKWRDYGTDFENDTFWTHVDYQHFECKCGYRETDWFGLVEEDRGKPHNKNCEYWWIDKPHFLHKPSGYGVKWYKYPCREAYGNQPKTLEEFKAIIDDCINSTLQAVP